MTDVSSAELPLILIGSGGHARVLLETLRLLGRNVLFLTDRDVARHGLSVGGIKIAGDDDIILQHPPQTVRLVNAVGSTDIAHSRHQVFKRFTEAGYAFATILHPSVTIAQDVKLGHGAQVMAGVILQPGVQVGADTIINTSASIDHDCVIGEHVHIAPGATLSGGVQVGALTHIGTGAIVIQGVRIGREVLIAAGGTVVKNVEDGTRVAGVPARPMHHAPAVCEASAEKPFTIMLSASGRRVKLMQHIQESIAELKLPARILATDVLALSAAFQLAQLRQIVPRYREERCLPELLRICRELNVKLIVPTIDPDLIFYTEHQAAFESIGTQIMVASALGVRISNDKVATHQWLVDNGFPTLRQTTVEALKNGEQGWQYPLFAKPRGGSASVGAHVVHNEQELAVYTRDDEFIAQEIARGLEYTVDVYVDKAGRCRCAVPRLRLETRGGEVVKGMTVRNPLIEETAIRIAETLPGAWGVLNIQMFYDQASQHLAVIEINARFGGGYPLTHAAGAPMTRWMLEELTGRELTARNDQWIDGLVMLRYDDAVYVSREEADVDLDKLIRAKQKKK